MPQSAENIFRDFTTDGIPASGKHEPRKVEIREWGTALEVFRDAGLSSGSSAIYDTRANLEANLVWIANTLAWVVADSTAANNGIYRKIGASGTGSWTRVADLPYSFIKATDAGAGTPNAIQATSSLPVSSSSLVALNIFEANTGSPVTVSFNGGTALTVKTNSGNDVAPGGFAAGMIVAGYVSGSTFRLLTDQVSAAIVAAAEAAAAVAEAARDATLEALSGTVAPKATLALAIADAPEVDPEYYDVAYFNTAYQTKSGAKYRKVASEPTHPGKFQNANGTWYEIDAHKLHPPMFGECGTADDYAVFQKWAQTSVALLRPWVIPYGTYTLNGAAPIILKTSGDCYGKISIPKSNHTCRFSFERDDGAPGTGGTVLSTSAWDSLSRGKSYIGAANAMGKNLWLLSTEQVIERLNPPSNTGYKKTEMIRVPGGNTVHTGMASTGLVHTYVNKANLTVRAYESSVPIIVNNLRIHRTGTLSGTETHLGSIAVWRDNVVLNRPIIIDDNRNSPISIGIAVSVCCDVTINDPIIRGLQYDGLGYGIIFGTTIGCTVNRGNILDCRHAITGANNVDLHIIGGNYGYTLDDHWGDRMVIKDVVLYTLNGAGAIEFAGNDILIDNVKQFGGRSLLGIRIDTPQLGGDVVIRNITVDSRDAVSGFFYIFGYSSPNGVTSALSPARTIIPLLPASVIIEDINIVTEAGYAALAWLGGSVEQRVNWGEVTIRGKAICNKPLFGIFAVKNSTLDLSRTPTFTVDGPIDFGTGQAVYVEEGGSTSATRAPNIIIRRIKRGSIRGRPNAIGSLVVENSGINSFENDGGSVNTNLIMQFKGCRMLGGAVASTWYNMAFLGCVFEGNYTAWPASQTMVGNVKISGVTGLPADIRAAVVSPFA